MKATELNKYIQSGLSQNSNDMVAVYNALLALSNKAHMKPLLVTQEDCEKAMELVDKLNGLCKG